MKYKIGEKVKVREDLKSGKIYGGMSCNPDMEELKGQIVTIVDFCATHSGYEINKDNKGYVWTDEMFEDLVKSVEDKKYVIHIRFVNGGNINLFNATQKQTEEFMKGMENCSRFMAYVDEDQKIFINAYNVTHYKIECLK